MAKAVQDAKGGSSGCTMEAARFGSKAQCFQMESRWCTDENSSFPWVPGIPPNATWVTLLRPFQKPP